MTQVIKSNIHGMSVGFLNKYELTLHDVFSGEKSSTPIIFGLINFEGSKVLKNIQIPLFVQPINFLLLVNFKEII